MEKFKTLSELNKYLALHDKELTKETVFEVEKNNMKYMYIPSDRVLTPLSAAAAKGMGGVEMSMEEINSQIISQLPALTEEQLTEKVKDINDWADTWIWGDGYYMLLCNEVRYYTMFCKPHAGEEIHFTSLGEAVIQCALVVGSIQQVDVDNDKVEIWIKNKMTGDTNCYLLFDYSGGVATYGG